MAVLSQLPLPPILFTPQRVSLAMHSHHLIVKSRVFSMSRYAFFYTRLGKAITMQSRDRYGNNLTVGGADVIVKMQNVGMSTMRLKDHGDGTYSGSTELQKAGNYLVVITLNGEPIHNSPFRMTVWPGMTVASACTVSGGGLYSWVAGRPSLLLITARDKMGNATDDPSLQFRVRVKHFQDVDEPVESQGDGTYSAWFVVPCPTKCVIEITLDGEHVKGSPFTSTIVAAGCMSYLHISHVHS